MLKLSVFINNEKYMAGISEIIKIIAIFFFPETKILLKELND